MDGHDVPRAGANALKMRLASLICAVVSIRYLLAALIALTVLLAPFAMPSDAAMAAMPSTHHAQVADADHCQAQPDDGQPASNGDHMCCPAMCSAMALPPAAVADPAALQTVSDPPGTDRVAPSHVARLPTPPPRSA